MISTFKRYECRTTMLVDFPERQVNTFHVFAFFGRLIHVVAILVFLLAIIEQFFILSPSPPLLICRVWLSADHLVSYLWMRTTTGSIAACASRLYFAHSKQSVGRSMKVSVPSVVMFLIGCFLLDWETITVPLWSKTNQFWHQSWRSSVSFANLSGKMAYDARCLPEVLDARQSITFNERQ